MKQTIYSNLLSIDCAGSVLSVALAHEDEIICTETDTKMKHSELIMDCIDSLLKKACIRQNDLNGILCMGGPGSFTGLRIGYSIAKGMALGLSIPFTVVPTLECIAFQNKETVLAVIESRKNAFFYAFFNDDKRLTDDRDADITQIISEIRQINNKITLTGPGSVLIYDSSANDIKNNLILKQNNKGYAKELISIAKKKKIMDNDNSANLYSGPEYIRESDAQAALNQSMNMK